MLDFLPGACRDPLPLKLEAKQASCKSARAALARYARWPTQAITYRAGKEQILALRRRAQHELGARFSAQRFHLEFMKQGTIPAGYFGEELLRTLRAGAQVALPQAAVGLADEQVRRQHVERLEFAADVAEGPLQVRERARGELEDEERAPPARAPRGSCAGCARAAHRGDRAEAGCRR